MDRFQEMQVFVRVAERSSFTLAADDLQMPRATVTNMIKRLEARLNCRLLERTTRQVRVTQEGQYFYRRCLQILSDVEDTERTFLEKNPSGLLRVNLQGTLASHFVTPYLGDFTRRYPNIRLHIGEDDRLIDLVREGVDCVLRAGTLHDSTLIARPLAYMPQVTVASPDYLETNGTPKTLEQLANHRAIAYNPHGNGEQTTLDFRVNQQLTEVTLPASLIVNGADLYTGAALAGLGIIQVPRYRIEQQLQQKQLLEILPQTPPPPMPVSALMTHNRQLSSRTRVFVDWLVERFSAV
ncbi:LysR family transcriptional regulator [Reinekea marinisedimentorum]|uniref:DNA-binding transcriptional LysR family regulator n=1 Tax=Reinekea marinisedimentorum TaxID=230495 RepID=A0A4R3HZA0_9GAMM|nr:LysR family transcriptional regulator [Reinekea marinisedimentorum]TCS37585.1 DNA-binding transcriptional LysR family regulator [Reinekea marinisedimentorum]